MRLKVKKGVKHEKEEKEQEEEKEKEEGGEKEGAEDPKESLVVDVPAVSVASAEKYPARGSDGQK